jgi:hypothetical protein
MEKLLKEFIWTEPSCWYQSYWKSLSGQNLAAETKATGHNLAADTKATGRNLDAD